MEDKPVDQDSPFHSFNRLDGGRRAIHQKLAQEAIIERQASPINHLVREPASQTLRS